MMSASCMCAGIKGVLSTPHVIHSVVDAKHFVTINPVVDNDNRVPLHSIK
jgi:hypothetical protein